MIIGDDLHQAVLNADLDIPVLEVEVHAGYRDNTKGVILTLEAAKDKGIIDEAEFQRQKSLLEKATEVERLYGAASSEYLAPERGDLKYEAAARLLQLIREGKRGLNILNAKKETAYMFADITAAVAEVAGDQVDTLANLDDQVGLPKVRRDAGNIARDLAERNVDFKLIGGLDEYPVTGEAVSRLALRRHYDFAVISGVPHALPVSALQGLEIFSITNGPRQVKPLRDLGHQHVTVELDLHPKTMGVTSLVESEFGATLRALNKAKAKEEIALKRVKIFFQKALGSSVSSAYMTKPNGTDDAYAGHGDLGDHSELFSAGLSGQLQDPDVLIYVRGRHGDAQIFHLSSRSSFPLRSSLFLRSSFCFRELFFSVSLVPSLIPQEERIRE